MHTALNKTLSSIPDDTKVYVCGIPTFALFGANKLEPGHEYTKANVKFGISVLQNEAIKKLQSFAENNKETQGQFTIADEKVCKQYFK
jgi:hydroxyacylglutathione hydrolase